jgi:hypothetical protein
MTDVAELASEVLIKVAEFVRKLPAEQLASVVSGEARLDLVPKGARVVAPGGSAAKAGAALPRPAQEISATMSGTGDRVAARRYLEKDLKLTVAQLKALAKELDITATGTKPKMLDGIVEWAVGRRQDSEAISRAGAAR